LDFWAEITRLPSHCASMVPPENATAQTVPSRATSVAHIWLLSPLASAITAADSACFSAP
jgi:hypothetical protein